RAVHRARHPAPPPRAAVAERGVRPGSPGEAAAAHPRALSGGGSAGWPAGLRGVQHRARGGAGPGGAVAPEASRLHARDAARGGAAGLAAGPGCAANLARAGRDGRVLRRAASSPGVKRRDFSSPPAVWSRHNAALFQEMVMTRALALVLCLAAIPALAFEGAIETKMTMTSSKMAESGGPKSVS